LDRHSSIVERGLPVELAAVSGDVGDDQRSLRPGRFAQDHQFDPLFVEAVDVLDVDEVLGGVLAARINIRINDEESTYFWQRYVSSKA